MSTAAQCPRWEIGPLAIPDPNPNGQILAMTSWDPDGAGPAAPLLVIGGSFTSIGGIVANRIAVFNGFHWSSLGSGCNGDVRALSEFNGQLIAGGDFTSAGGVALNHIARWNGSTWQNLGTGTVGGSPSGRVSALTVFNNELIVGGSFTAAGGLAANCIAKWNGTTWGGVGSGFTISQNSPRVECLTVFEGMLYAGGFFTSAGGNPANNIARWNGSVWSKLGFASFTDNGADSVVRCFMIHDFGGTTGVQLVVGGSFTNVSTGLVTLASPGVARWSGSNWFSLAGGIPGATVGGLANDGSHIIAGGFFPGAFNSVARWNSSSNTWQSFNSGLDLGSVQVMLNFNHPYAGQRIMLGGAFQGVGGEAINNFARVNYPDIEAAELPFEPFAYANLGSRLIAGGFGAQLSGASGAIDNIVAWDGVTLSPLGTGLNGWASAMSGRTVNSTTNAMIVGGLFSIAGGLAANNVALWTEDTSTSSGAWSAMGSGFNNEVLATAVFRSQFAAGGSFTHSGGTVVNGIARWNGTAWNPCTTGVSGPSGGRIYALTTRVTGPFDNQQHQLIVGGSFTTAGGVAANNVAAWFENTVTHPLNGWITFGNGFNGSVLALAMHGGSIYAGGDFTLPGGNGSTPLNHVARWTGSTWVQVGTGLPSSVHALLSKGSALYALMGGQNAALMKWDGAAWTAVPGFPQSNEGFSNPFAMAAHHNEIHVGGRFDTINAGTTPSPSWARYFETGAPWIARQPTSQNRACGSFANFSIQPAMGYNNLTYSWRHNGIALSNGVTAHGSSINGANASVLSIFNLKNEDAGEYDCVVANECGSETSIVAGLFIFPACCPGDFNGDQIIGVPDLLVVINFWGPCPGGCDADIAPPGGDGAVGVPDMLSIINNWGSCP